MTFIMVRYGFLKTFSVVNILKLNGSASYGVVHTNSSSYIDLRKASRDFDGYL